MNPEQEIKELKDKLKKLEAVLFGTSNDERFKAKIRKIVIDDRDTSGNPIIVNTDNIRWSVNDVTKLWELIYHVISPGHSQTMVTF